LRLAYVGFHAEADPKTFKIYAGDDDPKVDTTISTLGKRFVAGSIDITNGVLTLYIDPTGLGIGTAPSGAAGTATWNKGSAFSGFTGFESVAVAVFNWDEVRVGTTWADVSTVIPEPSTLASVGLVAGMLMRRRIRSKSV